MTNPLNFPPDGTGDALRRLAQGGDDLAQPRVLDFFFIFRERRQALDFAEVVDDPDKEVCISYIEDRAAWQAIIKHSMVPAHWAITSQEIALTAKAKLFRGEPEGWACLLISRIRKRN
jgi:hypothetical protein